MPTDVAPPILIVAQINEKLGPLDRGDRYEDPLDIILKEKGIGAVSGGGTQLSELGEIMYCDVEIELAGDRADALPLVKEALESLGAPLGSKLISETSELPIGHMEGLALYLNGTDLPDEVYETSDVNDLVDEIERALGTAGRLSGDWQGPTETALYLYGPSFGAMHERLAQLVGSYPLCQKSRVVRIA